LNALSAQRDLGPQIEVSLETLTAGTVSVAQQIQYLDNLMAALKAKEQALAVARADIPAKILKAQGELQQAQTEMDRLARAITLTEETYLALSRKADELRIASQLESGEVRIASPAVAPVKPSSPKKALNTVVGAMLGLIIGIIGAFVAEYSGKPDRVPEQR
jgi:uncharacterized protein involved in exopolysaccharide biosynthesis